MTLQPDRQTNMQSHTETCIYLQSQRQAYRKLET